jgi:serine/threonine-protein kinase HipA
MTKRVFVHGMLPDGQVSLAGVFAMQNGNGFFRYHKNWLRNGYQISFDLPLQDILHQKNGDINQGVFGALRDGMPDFWGQLVISKKLRIPFDRLSVIDLMLNTDGFSQIGALSFQETQEYVPPTASPPQFSDIGILCEVAKKIESNVKDIPPEYLMLLAQGSSMGGARPKTSVMIDGVAKLAKLPSYRDSVNNARLEHACLSLADMCGLITPPHQVIDIEHYGSVLLLDRFDRNYDVKIPYQSTLSLLGLDESENVYGGYPAIAREIRRIASKPDDVHRLFKHMAFNALIRNTDDHLRNHGLLMQENGYWALAPIFDLAPTSALAGVGREFFSAINLGEMGRVATVDNLVSACRDFLLEPYEAENIIQEMASTVQSHWKNVFSTNGIDAELFTGCFDNDLHAHFSRSIGFSMG